MITQLLLSSFLLSITLTSIAAIVQPTKLNDHPIQFLDKNNASSYSYIPEQIEANHYNKDILINSPNIELRQQENTNQSVHYKLETFANKLMNEYGEHELVQQSLSALYDAKQLWEAADSQANVFAADIFFSLKLDELIDNELTISQQSLQNHSYSGLLKNDLDFAVQSHNTSDISFYQVQQAQVNSSKEDLHQSNDNLISILFRTTTLYYLLAFFICFSIVQWAIKLYLRFNP